MEKFKNDMITKLPNNRSELSWICNFTGKIIFKDDWISQRPNIINKKNNPSKYGILILKTINNDLYFPSNDDKTELINYLFTHSLKKIINLRNK